MTSGIITAAAKPPAPPAKGTHTAAPTEAAGFSELLDKPDARRQPPHTSPASSNSAQPGLWHGRTHKDGEMAADTDEKNDNPEKSKHEAATVSVSSVLFGLPVATIANGTQSGDNDPSAASLAAIPAGQAAGTAWAAVITAGKGISRTATDADLNKAEARPNGNSPADATPSAAASKPAAHLYSVTTTRALSGDPPAAVSTPASGKADATPTSTEGATTDDAAAAKQPRPSAKLQGVTVMASTAAAAAPPNATDNPRPTTKAGTGKSDEMASAPPNTDAGTDATAAPPDTRSRAMPVPPARPFGRNAGSNAGSNSHGGGSDPDNSSSAILRNAASTQTAGSAVFTGGGASTPLLGQTASSFVSGMGTPQTWATAVSQAAYMANAPAAAAPVRSLAIALQPAELGTVTARLHLSGQQLRVDVEVRTEEARQRLSSDADDIVKSLRNLGFDVSHITIRHGGNAMPPAAGTGPAAGQPQGNAPFQASTNSGGGHGGTTQGDAGKNNGNQEPQITAPRSTSGDGLSRGLYI